MKRIVLTTAVFVFAAAAFAQKKVADVAKFTNETIDFGKIKQGVPVERDFIYSNTGNAPLIISSARATCGCTTPKFSEAPLLPGKKDKIVAGFNAANLGAFVKTITVNSNATEEPIILKIKGEVVQ